MRKRSDDGLANPLRKFDVVFRCRRSDEDSKFSERIYQAIDTSLSHCDARDFCLSARRFCLKEMEPGAGDVGLVSSRSPSGHSATNDWPAYESRLHQHPRADRAFDEHILHPSRAAAHRACFANHAGKLSRDFCPREEKKSASHFCSRQSPGITLSGTEEGCCWRQLS